MGLRYIAISVVCTALSFAGLQFWTETSLVKLKSDGLLGENLIPAANVGHVVDLLLGSYATVGLLANFVLNAFVLLVLSLKVILPHPETFFFVSSLDFMLVKCFIRQCARVLRSLNRHCLFVPWMNMKSYW